ncbi:MAG: hypothetical protein E6H45_00665 [Betaproteobacteria bacterium]|nr:MAG: hypothetical protein E6H45_00665 [Betaproteobacteria bacterium]
MKNRLAAVVLIALVQLAGCGGGGGGGGPSVPTYAIGGTIANLTGSGLVLQLNGGSNLPVNANATAFTFITQLAAGAMYNVSVLTQPTSPSQTCTVSNGSGNVGSASVASISISCATKSFTIGGTVSGLSGSGLVLNNGGDNLPIGGNGAFTFSTPILSGANYAVTVLSQPTGPAQTCNVVSGLGTVGAGNVTSVRVFCGVFSISDLLDPLAAQQWHLKNTGQNAFADTGGVTTMDINVEPVFSTFGFTGNGVITAVVEPWIQTATTAPASPASSPWRGTTWEGSAWRRRRGSRDSISCRVTRRKLNSSIPWARRHPVRTAATSSFSIRVSALALPAMF